MSEEKNKLIKKEVELMKEVREDSINHFFKFDYNFKESKKFVKWMNKLSEVDEPVLFFEVDNPLACEYMANILDNKEVMNQVSNQVDIQVSNQVSNQVRNKVSKQVSNQVSNQVENKVWNKVSNQVSNQIRNQVSNQINNQVSNQISNQVWNKVDIQVSNQVMNQVMNQVSNQVWNKVWNKVSNKVINQVSKKVSNQVSNQVKNQVRNQVSNQVSNQISNQVDIQVSNQVMNQVRNKVWNQVMNQIWNQVENQVKNKVINQVSKQVKNQVSNQVRNKVENQVRNKVSNQVRNQVWNQVRNQKLKYYYLFNYGTSEDLYWCSFYDYFTRIGIIDNKLFNTYYEMLRKANIFAYINLGKTVVISKPPIFIKRDEKNRLHCETDYAIYFNGGYGQHYLHGIFIESELFNKVVKKTITSKEVLSIKNTEQKAVIIQYIGYNKIIKDLDCKILDEVKETSKVDGKPVHYQVLEFELDNIPVRVVMVECHTEHKITTLGVPRIEQTEDCFGAISWTMGLNKEDYKPIIET